MKKHVRGDMTITFQEDGQQKTVELKQASLVLNWQSSKSVDRPDTDAVWFEVVSPWVVPEIV